MAHICGRMFVWIWSWWWLATTFGVQICSWYLYIREVFPWNHDVVGTTCSILWVCKPEVQWGKKSYERIETGIGSQMVGRHVVRTRFQKCNSGYRLPFASCELRLLCQQIEFSEPKCVRQKQIEILRCHRDTNRGASVVPIWTNLISTFDVWSDAQLELQARSARGIRGTNFCMSGIDACEKWLRHVTWKHLRKTMFFNNRKLFATSWVSLSDVGYWQRGSLLRYGKVRPSGHQSRGGVRCWIGPGWNWLFHVSFAGLAFCKWHLRPSRNKAKAEKCTG